MLKKESLEKLMSLVINDNPLNYHSLRTCDFKWYNLGELVLNKDLQIVGLNHYKFINTTSLYNYSLNLMAQRRIQEAKKGFKACLKIDSNYYPAALQLFNKAIETEEYEMAHYYFRIMEKSGALEQSEKNFFLFLLSFLTDLTVEEKKYLKGLHTEDILLNIDDSSPKNIQINKIRKLAFYQKFSGARKLLYEYFPIEYNNSPNNFALHILLKQNLKLQKETSAKLAELACAEDYSAIITFINRLKEKQAMNSYLKDILYLAKTCDSIIKTGVLPTVNHQKTNSFKYAIYHNNFLRAFQIKQKKEIIHSHDAIYYLLSKLIILMDKSLKNNFDEEEIKIPNLVIAAKVNGIVILPKMSKNERLAITLNLQNYSGVSAFLIGLSGQERLVIKAGKAEEKNVNINDLVKLSKDTYATGQYEACILANMELLKYSHFSLETYAKLGVCHYKLGNYALAIDYLTIPTEIAKAQNLSSAYDYSNLINYLKCLLENPNNKKGGRK